MASNWSGLAPAVNSHLQRWGKSDAEWKKISRTIQRELGKGGIGDLNISAAQSPITYMWSVFARTWGLPTPDGGVITPGAVPMEGMTINGREQFTDTPASEKNGMGLMEREHRLLDKAETVYVSGEIVDRITYAAQSIAPEPLFHTDLFAPSGLIVLEKPIKLPDYHPGTGIMTDFIHVGIRAIGWTPEMVHCVDPDNFDPNEDVASQGERKPGTMIFTYTTNDDWKQTYARDVANAIRNGKLTMAEAAHIYGEQPSEDLDPEAFVTNGVYTMGAFAGRDHLVPSDVMAWAFGRPWQGRTEINYVPGTVDSAVSFMRRWFLTLMRFSWQKLIVPHRPPASPKLARRMKDARRPNAPYSVLRLRRVVEASEETGTGRPLGYRVQTRGHWKNVFVSSLGPARLEDGTYNPDSHRRQWIEAFWRGPEDGPMGPKHKATVIVR